MSSARISRGKKQHGKKPKARFGSAIPNQLYSMTFPREMKVTMRYAENLVRTPSAGLALDYVFNLNSIFDPDVTGVGHQPQGRDHWVLFYNRYRVDACKATVRLVGDASGTLTMLANNQSSAITGPSTGPESPMSTVLAIQNGGAAVTKTVHYDLAKLNGVTRAVYNSDDRYQALFSASPSEVLCLHTIWTETSLSTGVGVYQVVLEYQVTMFDPIQLNDS